MDWRKGGLSLLWLLYLIVEQSGGLTLTVNPSNITEFVEGNVLRVNMTFHNCVEPGNISISLVEGTEYTLKYPDYVYLIPCADNITNDVSTPVELHAEVVGYVTLAMKELKSKELLLEYPVGVIRPERQAKDLVFLYGIIILSVFNTLCFGINLDLEKVKKYIKKPVAPAIGLVCQFIFMPLIAFTLIQMIQRHPAQELGVFAAGVAPGGGASNVWAYALGGDIDLSITMTFISSFAALAFVPLWIYTLGQYIIGDSNVTPPFKDMALTLTYIIVPVVIGLLINRFLTKVGKVILKAQKVVVAITILFAIIMGIYANLYAFKLVLFDYQLMLASMFLPWLGLAFGLLAGVITRREKPVTLTIGIETAVQNSTIATIFLRTSLPSPWNDISSAVPIVLNLFIPVPFYFILAGRLIYLRMKTKSKTSTTNESDTKEHKLKEEMGEQNPTFEGEANDEPATTNGEKLTEL